MTEKEMDQESTSNLKVISQDGGEVHFKVKQSISMAKLKSYAERQGVSIAS